MSYVVPVKSKVSQNFVAFSEYMNFKIVIKAVVTDLRNDLLYVLIENILIAKLVNEKVKIVN